jgi:hypothetical protein
MDRYPEVNYLNGISNYNCRPVCAGNSNVSGYKQRVRKERKELRKMNEIRGKRNKKTSK